ncbi:MAG TPA: translocation/assembly module TamB domain-containing protein, partial [Pseudomonadales bacterium]|nr:translocation/assembly module TamB domain-containing protein [Pseudomonadales bacterium]
VTLPRVFLPLLIDVKSLEVKTLRVQRADSIFVISDIFLQAQAALPKLNVIAARASYAGVQIGLNGGIQLENEYPLHAEATVDHPGSNTHVQLKAENSVTRLKITADVKQQGELHLAGTIQPLETSLPMAFTASSSGAFHYELAPAQTLILDQLQMSATGDLQQLKLNGGLHAAGTAVPETSAEMHAELKGRQLAVDNISLHTLGGEANVQGTLEFGEQQSWQAQWQLKNIQTQNFWPELQSQLNGNGSSSGMLKGTQLNYSVRVDQLSGHWRSYVLNANGALNHENNLWTLENINLALGSNNVKLNGSLNHEWNLTGEISAPNLRAFWPTLAGELKGQFTLSGEPKQPTIAADLNGKNVLFNGFRANLINLKSSVVRLAQESSTLTLRVDGLEVPGYEVGLITLDASGTQAAHNLTLAVNGPAAQTNARLTGQWNDKGWDGSLQTANLQIKSTAIADWTLAQPLPMRWRKKSGFKIEAFCWQHVSASLCSEGPIVLGPKGQLALNLQGLQTAWLEPHFPDGFRWLASLNLRANVAWAPDTPSRADFQFSSSPGVIRLEQVNATSLEFRYGQLSANGELKNNQLQTSALFESENLGQLNADINVALKDPTQRTLDGRLKLTGLQLNVFKPFYSRLDSLEGVLSADGRVAGTVDAPKFIGSINLANGKVTAENLPLPLENIQAKADLYGSNASLTGQFSSGDGYGNLSGNFNWDKALRGIVRLTGDKLQLKPTRGLKMTVQPDLKADLADSNLKLTGKVAVTSGKLTTKALPIDAVEESGDTVIVGEQKAKQSVLKISTDVLVTVAENFEFSGFGAEGKLGGEIRVTQAPEQDMPFGDGEIKVVDGKYTIYGQRLTIRTGRILFGGPVDLPIVQVEAIRRIEDQIVGIRIFGRVDQATSTLFSEPSLPEETALSYLVTGRPPSASNSTQSNNYMGQAAVALGVMGGEGVARDVAEKMGVSDFSLSSDTTTEGKQLVAVAGYISPK